MYFLTWSAFIFLSSLQLFIIIVYLPSVCLVPSRISLLHLTLILYFLKHLWIIYFLWLNIAIILELGKRLKFGFVCFFPEGVRRLCLLCSICWLCCRSSNAWNILNVILWATLFFLYIVGI